MSIDIQRREQIESELRLIPGGFNRAILLVLLELNDLVDKLVERTPPLRHVHTWEATGVRYHTHQIGGPSTLVLRRCTECGDNSDVSIQDHWTLEEVRGDDS